MPAYEDSVFINCPFTADYRPLFQALVFAVADCGYVPRCSLERSDSSESRIDKIFRIINGCRYGVHDISATELDPTHNLPRFNMPLELGIFLAAKRFGGPKQKKKTCLVLDSHRYRYQKFCSDIAGQDPKAHQGKPKQALVCVRDWLKDEKPDEMLPGGTAMYKRYQTFQKDLPLICAAQQLEPGELKFNDLTTVLEVWLNANSWGS
ncbi:MAG: hypothetical protein ACE5GX_06330 [Thermoanaerobaculia bacterium]